MIKRNKITAFFLAAATAISVALTGCHGSQSRQAFAVPEQFDESK